MGENIEDICYICGDKGADINLESISFSLPSYLLKKDNIHLTCLKYEVNRHVTFIKEGRFPILLAVGFFIGLILLPFSFLFFIIPIIIAYLIILSIEFFKYLTRSSRMMRWILKQQKQQKMNDMMENNLEESCVLCGKKEIDLPEYVKKRGKIRLNLLSIPCVLPKYLPEKGTVHLDCLEGAVYEFRNYLNYNILVLLMIFIMILGSVSGFILWHLLDSIGYFGSISAITFFVMLSMLLPYLLTPTYQLRKWIKKQYSNEGE